MELCLGFHFLLLMASHHYVVTVQQPTTVTHCIKGHFLSSSSLDVIIAKGSKLELYSVSESGLTPIYDVSLYGRVAALTKYGIESSIPLFLMMVR